ncbi:hypothetical protein GLU01_00525 [Nanohaloarchaea archaeon]|nr:hypothetical protein [Candidatus Nanohaloarchaea archaeon]
MDGAVRRDQIPRKHLHNNRERQTVSFEELRKESKTMRIAGDHYVVKALMKDLTLEG